jgi:hypothetical protein
VSSRAQILRIVTAFIGTACAGFLALAALLGGLHRDDPTDRALTAFFALAVAGATVLALARRPRWAGMGFAALAIAGIAWDVALGADLRPTWGFWAALAVAGGLSWAGGRP